MICTDVRIEQGIMDFVLRGADPFPVRCVFVHDVNREGSVSSGLTELDALGNYREHEAFLMQVSPSDIEVRVLD